MKAVVITIRDIVDESDLADYLKIKQKNEV